MRGYLRPYILQAEALDALAYDLITAVTRIDGPENLFVAQTSLLTRVLQDLRVSVLCTERGYTMQGWSVTTSAFEAAHTMGYLAVNPERATAWLEHKSTSQAFCPVYSAVEGTYKHLDLGDAGAERTEFVKQEYAHYKSLCAAKHVNPIAEKTRYIRPSQKGRRLTITPILSERRVREGQFGLALACRAATLGVWLFHKSYLAPETTHFARVLSLADESTRLLLKWRDVEI